ncbi:MAG: phosphodiester glycosidase family protein, partial [Bdellovibrionales bacterium]|nr:phosphodiester glycosidase family protein [Bdellovibrionales bacterium]
MKVLIFALVIVLTPKQSFSASIDWQTIGEDLELGQADISEGILRSGRITMLRTSLLRFRPEVIIARNYDKQVSNVKQLAVLSKASIVINANFFDEQKNPLGLVIHRGQKLNPIHAGGRTLTGIFKVERNSIGIVHRDSFLPDRVVEAVQAGPRLIVDNEPVAKLNKTSSRRSGICIDRENRLLLFIFTGSFLGITHEELQALLLDDSV